MLLSVITLTLLSLTYYLYHRLTTTRRPRHHLASSKPCLPPAKFPSRDPILGLDFFWAGYKAIKEHRALERFAELYWALGKNTAEINGRIGGNGRIVSTIEPENLKWVLSTRFREWGIGEERKKFVEPFLGQGIFTSDGAEWQHSRDMLRPNFARTQVADCEMFERHVQRLFETISKHGGEVDLQKLFFIMTLDVATEFLFGQSTDCLSPEGGDAETKGFVRALDHVLAVLGGADMGLAFFLAMMVGINMLNSQLKKEYKVVHDYVEGIIEKALANKDRFGDEKETPGMIHAVDKKRYIFLHELLNQTTDKVKIRAELLNILLAGRETTAALLSNVWFELSKRPAIWTKLQHEVSSLEGENPTFEQLKDMKYLQALLKESLRLYPVAPENIRVARVDTVLPVGGGEDGKAPIFMKKGRRAHWSIYVMHRRKDLYGEDAEKFRPERWLDSEDGKGLRVGWEYLPFSGGPRICIGQQFALTEVSYITVRLMQEFAEIESRDPEPWREKLSGFVCTGLGGCKVVLKPRV